MNSLVTQRLVEMTFAPFEQITAWLADTLKLEIVRREEGIIVVRNPHLNMTTAVMAETDPVTRGVCLGIATAGVHWTRVYPNLLQEIDWEWRRRAKAARAARQQSRGQPAFAPISYADIYRTEAPDGTGALSNSPKKGNRAMSHQQFAEILFANDLQPDDVDILIEATAEKPGLLKLNRAYLGSPRPDAPNSAPLFSWTGAQIGYVAAETLLEPPFMDTYWLAREDENEDGL